MEFLDSVKKLNKHHSEKIMKLLKKLSVALLAAACMSTATAWAAGPTIIHAVGSTAFRAGTTIAIIDALAGTRVTVNPAYTGPGQGQDNYLVTPGSTTVYGTTSASPMTGATYDIFANGKIGGASPAATVIVEVTWTGSLAGVVDATAQATANQFYDETNANVIAAVNANIIPTTGATAYATPATLTNTGNTKTVSDIELAMSDAVNTTVAKEMLNTGAILLPQGTGPGQYNYPAGNGFSAGQQHVGPYGSVNALATACYGNTIKDAGTVAPGAVAIVPFQWVVGNMNGVNGTAGTATKYGDGSSFTVPTNITQQVANQLIGVGAVPQALFTGLSNEADFGNWFMFLGRNEDSGTRILYLMESQFGVTTAPVQWSPENSFTGSTTQAETTLYPVTPLNTEPMIEWNTVGHSGFTSGGNISGPLSTSNNGNVNMDPNYTPSGDYANGYFISSLGIPDAYNATKAAAPGTNLTYNGVAFSPANVQNGSYSHWGYEHCYRPSNLGSTAAGLVDAVADIVTGYDVDTFYLSSAGANGWVTHSENTSTGVYTPGPTVNGVPQWPVGVKLDEWVQVDRSTTEGGPIGTLY